MPDRRPSRHKSGRPMQLGKPEPGHYRTKRGGCWVGALVYEVPARDPETRKAMERTSALGCLVDGDEADIEAVWTRLHPVSKDEYDHLRRESADVRHKGLPLRESPVRF